MAKRGMSQSILKIDTNAIYNNWQSLDKKSAKNVETAAVIKADAYGLSTKNIASYLAFKNVKTFFVAIAEEGIEARKAVGNDADIFVFSGQMENDAAIIKEYNLIPLLNSADQYHQFQINSPNQKFGIQLDTGMNRLCMEGIEFSSLDKNISNACLIMSHLACADEPNHSQNLKQLRTFHHLTDDLKIRKSLSATGGILLGPEYHFDLCRPGIGLYGGFPYDTALPVIKLSIPVIQSRTVFAGETVGYGGQWRAKTDTRVATISAGYADGLIRAIGNGQLLLYHGDVGCPLIGRVSMDLITVDITQLDDTPRSLDLINKIQTVDIIANAANTIGYEILTSLGARYAREYIKG